MKKRMKVKTWSEPIWANYRRSQPIEKQFSIHFCVWLKSSVFCGWARDCLFIVVCTQRKLIWVADGERSLILMNRSKTKEEKINAMNHLPPCLMTCVPRKRPTTDSVSVEIELKQNQIAWVDISSKSTKSINDRISKRQVLCHFSPPPCVCACKKDLEWKNFRSSNEYKNCEIN